MLAAEISLCQAHGAEMSVKVRYRQNAVLTISGPIVYGDAKKFEDLAVMWGKRGFWIGYVRLWSPGGSVSEALQIGRQIRMMKAATGAPRLMDDGITRRCVRKTPVDMEVRDIYWNTRTKQGDSGCDCASACFLIWVAGVGRFGNVLGVHRPSFDAKYFAGLTPTEASQVYERMSGEVSDYLREMDVAQPIIDRMFAFSSSEMDYLSALDIRLMNNGSKALSELRDARCGSAPDGTYRNPDLADATKTFLECGYQLDEEAQREAWASYMQKYRRPRLVGFHPTTTVEERMTVVPQPSPVEPTKPARP